MSGIGKINNSNNNKKEKTNNKKHRKFSKWETALIMSTAALLTGLVVVGSSPQVSYAGYQ